MLAWNPVSTDENEMTYEYRQIRFNLQVKCCCGSSDCWTNKRYVGVYHTRRDAARYCV